ncbi:hypothetical protein [Bifidobacterium sp. SO4]|uniref:hypothetical protein n=1 Tax=Bifidobacterium sp. SO4 TaxID=2809030 RepID=UPI001BDD092C|nr:hypothetical protein [Bifidobacterium sp. SO4]MBT1171217.1 hypothetical protein [Bifidobacterium sp. SO4]
MKNSYYSQDLSVFLNENTQTIFGIINQNKTTSDTAEQAYAWNEEIEILQRELKNLDDGRILLEYVIPRMGKRADAILLYRNIVFILEFKC